MLLDMHQALRCHAKSKRSGLRCQAPAVRGSSVCRMHGAGGGAPKGNRNALKRDHVGDGLGAADFKICAWRTNDAKHDLYT